jgi:HD-GYP domain-containing protein (c-di-GMP phosphodiesterase class II)
MQFAPLPKQTPRAGSGGPHLSKTNNADPALLLAGAKKSRKSEQRDAPIDRSVLLHLDKMVDPVDLSRRAPTSMLPAIWDESRARIISTMRDPSSPEFRMRLETACATLQALMARDPNLAILQVLRQDGNARREYGMQHAIRTAVIGLLIANRLKWSASASNIVINCALTMNLSILELQGALAVSTVEPNAVQRRVIVNHPTRSREMLEAAGIKDALWLVAVEQHHEEPDGRGYPAGLTDVNVIASLVRCADVYATQLSERPGQEAMPPDRIIRNLYKSDPDNPFVAALVKEFGIYPPGSFVALNSGEAALVIRRGTTFTTPIVAALTNRYRRPLAHPIRRDTARPGYGVIGLIKPSDVPLSTKSLALSAILSV